MVELGGSPSLEPNNITLSPRVRPIRKNNFFHWYGRVGGVGHGLCLTNFFSFLSLSPVVKQELRVTLLSNRFSKEQTSFI